MQGLRQLLASSLLLAAIFGVLADQTGLEASQRTQTGLSPAKGSARGSAPDDDSQPSVIDNAQDAPTNAQSFASSDRSPNVLLASPGDVGYSALEHAIRDGGYKLPLTLDALRPSAGALGQGGLLLQPSLAEGSTYSDDAENQDDDTDNVDTQESQQGSSRVKRGGYNAPYFVGKRSLEEEEELSQEELQKRQEESEENVTEDDDLTTEMEELGLLDSDDKRAAPMFVGKRPRPWIVGKRQRPIFVGKRPKPLFVGKRYKPMFVGKRYRPMFVGKRPQPMFVGKRARPMFVGKRGRPMFVGKRARPMFVGKRAAPMFVGKRAAPMFVGKRYRPLFVGKRQEENLSELLAALHTLQAARQYRRMIQTDKRYESPFFVGRRSDLSSAEVSSQGVSTESKDGYFR